MQIKCKCGCGAKLDKYDKWGRPRKYVSGHNVRKYYGKESGNWAIQRRWRKNNPDKVRRNKREYYRQRKLKAMTLLGNKCLYCNTVYNGSNAPIFEFHHPDPSVKENGITRMLTNKAWETTLVELAKCVLICANCHNQYHGGEW